MQDLESNNWIILEFIWNNSDTFIELTQDNTHFLSEFISNNIYWYFQRVTIKQYYTLFSEFILHNTFSGSYYKKTLHIFAEFTSNNIYTSRVTTKQYYKIILFSIIFYQTKHFHTTRCTTQYSLPLGDSDPLLKFISEKFSPQKTSNFKILQPALISGGSIPYVFRDLWTRIFWNHSDG